MNRQQISDILFKALLPINILVWIIIFGSFAFIDINLHEPGEMAGQGAIVMLWIVSLPGILKRFKVSGLLQSVQIILMRSRRRIGILMFSLAVMHYYWVRLFLYIRFEYFPQAGDFPLFETMGFLSLFLLFPLFITSNNFSVKLLKKNWGRIHKLIYVAMWLAAFHVALQGELQWAIPTFTIAILQLLSWVNHWKGQKAIQAAQPTQPQEAAPQN